MLTAIREIFDRDLAKLQEELRLYPSDAAVWTVPEGIANSAGTLALHLSGNLNHFVGGGLGRTGYVRDRDREFSARDVPRAELLAGLDETRAVVWQALSHTDEAVLTENFPLDKRGEIVRTDHMLLHLLGHLSYHLGQVNYHRRLTAY